MAIHKTDYYDAAEELVTYYYVRGRRVKSSEGPRKKIKQDHLNIFFLLSIAINKKRLEMCYLKHTGYVLN